jgi:4-amino-4-deoxychorismate lyase
VSLHEERLNRSRNLLFGCNDRLSLTPELKIPVSMRERKVKCRVTYSNEIENIEYEEYVERKIKKLRLVINDTIDYRYKFENRQLLNTLFDTRGHADEILIVRNGEITDTSFTNIIFLKKGKWFTPELPLLPGTRREDYLRKGIIHPKIIKVDNLPDYEEARLINSMRSIEESDSILLSDIIW